MNAPGIFIHGTREVGSRAAHRVRVVETEGQPTCFAGLRGIVVDGHDHEAILVRLDIRGREVTLPFGISNLEVLR